MSQIKKKKKDKDSKTPTTEVLPLNLILKFFILIAYRQIFNIVRKSFKINVLLSIFTLIKTHVLSQKY